MKRAIDLCFACLCFVVFLDGEVHADVKLPAVFNNNMVLQQQSEVAVWGWAKPNTSITVAVSWNKKAYGAKSNAQGYWRLKIETPAAGFTPYTLTISDGKPVTIENILIGEVWVCSGQSNMNMRMRGCPEGHVEGGPEAIVLSSNPGIRCFTVSYASKATPLEDCTGIWETASPQTTPLFTATGYFFARLLNMTLNVPVGLIHTSLGGSSIEAWMTPNSLKNIPKIPVPAPYTEITNPYNTPTVLYNGMLHPIVGYGIRGAIWYQGESNRSESSLYAKMFDAMVRDWRNLWGIGEFPFYYCQITPYNYNDAYNSAYLREAQAKGMTTTPNTGMAVLMDANSPNTIHPANKRDAGERMALWALARTYGMNGIHYRSPEFKSLETEGRVAVVSFDIGTDPGLTAYDKEILNFQIAGKDKHFHPAKAACSGNRVYVFSPFVAEPVAVRYCFDDTSATELFSIEGNLPVSSFRTDDW